ncbi:hypothetical protein [Microbacterium sp. Bi128]|uniref:hypothetical protein n=1 Tax=Microbacterium sp. Bi128 TaxID=2821115 RepID=UPI001DF6A3F7|nr:hypothetical protein [Microbacterium sp. Bi128]CAH0254260.1 hypothetical protein SRABI128_02987 [Microbacterium sp. Bi128]
MFDRLSRTTGGALVIAGFGTLVAAVAFIVFGMTVALRGGAEIVTVGVLASTARSRGVRPSELFGELGLHSVE